MATSSPIRSPHGIMSIMMASSDKAKNGDATQQKKHLRRLSILLLGQTDVAHRKTTAHALKRVSDQTDFLNRNLVTEEGEDIRDRVCSRTIC